jgi:hypothetical protein
MAKDPLTSGVEHPEAAHKDIERHRELKDAKEGRKTFFDIGPKALTKMVRRRWDRMEETQKKRLAQIKVNNLRYHGHSFVQVHPTDPNRVFIPPGASAKRAPTINKIKRTVHRYVAQITADEPVMEGMPASHRDEDRDAAESSTKALRGEWQRLDLNAQLQRAIHFSAIMRSSFWHFKWDTNSGETQKAQKFFETDRGDRVLLYVDSAGKRVDDPSEAATIRSGNIKVDVQTPANVRWEGSRYAHDADEVMVAEMMSIRKLYEIHPKSRDVKVSVLIGESQRPMNGVEWLEDFRAETPRGSQRDFSEEEQSRTGSDIADDDNILDEKILVIHYYKRKSRSYPKGFHAITAGNYVMHKGPLRYGKIPVVQFKMLDEVGDPTGLSLVDLLREPQELLDFVNGQILRYLQMMKRRWFVPMYSGVKSRDLMSPTRSIIEYNAQAGAPTPEVQPEIPNSMVKFVERFDTEFDDQSGIHDTLQGKHVPGVSSGRHAEALRSGDETLLGLTRTQVKLALEKAAEVMLAIMQREWTIERRVRYMGDDREYVDIAFRSTDFGETSQVVLKNSTLLMLTPAQRLDTIMSLAEAGALGVDEIRRLAPLGDVMGISISEDVHYQRARRQNARFLMGPPKDLVAARRRYEDGLKMAQTQEDQINRLAAQGGDPDAIMVAFQTVEDAKAELELLWTEELDKYAFDHRSWEDRTDISKIHAMTHADALAQAKVDRFEEWWVAIFEDHTRLEWEMGFPQQVVEQAQVAQLTGAAPAPAEPGAEGIDAGAVESSPAGFDQTGQPPVVVGNAP